MMSPLSTPYPTRPLAVTGVAVRCMAEERGLPPVSLYPLSSGRICP